MANWSFGLRRGLGVGSVLLVPESVAEKGNQQVVAPQDESAERPVHRFGCRQLEAVEEAGDFPLSAGIGRQKKGRRPYKYQ